MRNRTGNLHLKFTEEIYYDALISIEYMCLMMSNKVLFQLSMPEPNRLMHDAFNEDMQRENCTISML